MRPRLLSAAALPASLWVLVTARLHNSLVPEDPYAFPKYRVAFMNGLPVLNETAQRWLQSGLRGGELEFLDQPWEEGSQWRTPLVKSIEGGDQDEQVVVAEVGVLPLLPDKREAYRSSHPQQEHPGHKLELMKMGPRNSYLCLIPPPPVDNTSIPTDEPADVTPAHTWSLLQPLTGSCLYVRVSNSVVKPS